MSFIKITEQDSLYNDLERKSVRELLEDINTEDQKVALAVRRTIPKIEELVLQIVPRMQQGGRIFYLGAGTSGRLGVLDAVECPPTFGVDPSRVVGLIAGGEGAFIKAVEGAEDSRTLCEEDLKKLGLTSKDIVIGLAASGRTPYVIYGLKYAASVGCKTVGIACNKGSEVGRQARLAIEPQPGPEVLTGSTRLKAGTCQKMVLNMISTGSMVGVGKAYENLMVDVKQSNEKLVVRAQNITMTATGCTREEAEEALKQAKGHVKTAITMLLLHCSASEAASKLEAAHGKIREALKTSTLK